MMARSTTLQPEAGYIDARLQSRQVDENLLRRTAGPYIRVKLRRTTPSAVSRLLIQFPTNLRADTVALRHGQFVPVNPPLEGKTSRTGKGSTPHPRPQAVCSAVSILRCGRIVRFLFPKD
jgi:hypothetical protein